MSHEDLDRLRDEARERRDQASQAAQRARQRIEQLARRDHGRRDGPDPSRAVERRVIAQDRLARVRLSLAEARRRSVNAHERAARVDASVGKHADAARHHEAADRDRRLTDDEAEGER